MCEMRRTAVLTWLFHKMQLTRILLLLLLGALNRDVAALGLSDIQGQISTFAEAMNASHFSGCNLAVCFTITPHDAESMAS